MHWFVTPILHPDASPAQSAAVLIQLVIGAGLAFWGRRQDKQDRAELGPQYSAIASFVVGSLFGVFLAGTGGHWLITPAAHPDASTTRVLFVWLQVAAGVGLIVVNSLRLTRATSAA